MWALYYNFVHRSLPVEALHTLLLGPVKYLLQELVERLTPAEKASIECRIDSFDLSGINGRISGSAICK